MRRGGAPRPSCGNEPLLRGLVIGLIKEVIGDHGSSWEITCGRALTIDSCRVHGWRRCWRAVA